MVRGSCLTIAALLLTSTGCDSLRVTSSERAAMSRCQESLSSQLGRAVAVRMTKSLEGIGKVKVVASVQVPVESRENVDPIKRATKEFIGSCLPTVNETVVEPVIWQQRTRD